MGSASKRLGSLAAGLAVALASSRAFADQVDVPADRDTTIFEESGTTSNGAGDYLFAGQTNGSKARRALLHFDVASAIPAGSTITSATLTLHCSQTKAGAETVAIHRALAQWGEGASNATLEEGKGAAAAAGDATWSHAVYPTTSWIAGGSFTPSASATTAVGDKNASYTWTSSAMTADVQGWVDGPAANFGWMIVGTETVKRTAKRFDARTFGDSSKRPLLRVVFTPPVAQQTGACCSADGSCGVVTHPGSACGGSYQGPNTTCSPSSCPQPAGACCLPVSTATCTSVTLAACAAQGGTHKGAGAVCNPNPCSPAGLTPFVDALPLPAVATPKSGSPGGAAKYELSIVEVSQSLHSQLPTTRVWGFSDGTGAGGYPGPTIEATSGVPIEVMWKNDLRGTNGALRTTHALAVEDCLTMGFGSGPRTVMHLHGGHVPIDADGYPEAAFLPGSSATYTYPNKQDAATLWYHDHAIGITRLNVYMGLAGFYLVRSPQENALGLPSGVFEIPLAIQDRSVKADGSLDYPASWVEHFMGDKLLVNGKIWPYLDVKRGKYRFRVLNGSTSMTHVLALSNGGSFVQIGSDLGLLAAPVTLPTLTLAPGERADVVVDFEPSSVGNEIVLRSSGADVMKLRVVAGTGHTAPLPALLSAIAPISESTATVTRDFVLAKESATCGGSMWLINGKHWDDITEKPVLGTTEIWRFVNQTGASHPMHMHLVRFQVLDRTPLAWKDTVDVPPGATVRVIARFEDYLGKYPYHCHVLEHEDNMMMRQFEVVAAPGGGDGGGPADGGATTDGGVVPPPSEGGVGGPDGSDEPGVGSDGASADGCSCREGASSTTSFPFAPLLGIGGLAFAALARRITSRQLRRHNVQSPS